MNRTARSIEELFPIIAYAKAGDLKSVKEWIKAGSPLNLPLGKKTRRQSPLQIAIEKGFLTLVDMLLKGGADPSADDALSQAVWLRRTDIVRLLLERGEPVDHARMADVCCSDDREMIQLFLDRGADPVKGDPFYEALIANHRQFYGLFKEHLARDPRLQAQADRALLYFAREHNARGISMTIWAGARPDATISDECGSSTTPLEAAVCFGDLACVKAMQPAKYPALLGGMLAAVYGDHAQVITEYLRSLGAPLNDREDGTCSVLATALMEANWDADPRRPFGGATPTSVDRQIARIEFLLAEGAKFPPTNERDLRGRLRHFNSEQLLRVLAALRKAGAFGEEFLLKVIATPKFREILGSRWQTACETIRPPAPKTLAAVATLPKDKPQPVPLDEVRAHMTALLLGNFVGISHHFTKTHVRKIWRHAELRRKLRLPKDDERDLEPILRDSATRLGRRLRCAKVEFEPNSYRGGLPYMVIQLDPERTWDELQQEIACLQRDEAESRSAGDAADAADAVAPQPTTLPPELAGVTAWNVVWEGNIARYGKADLDKIHATWIQLILERKPVGSGALLLYRLRTTAEVCNCFPQWNTESYPPGGPIATFLKAVRLPSCLGLAFDLSHESSQWWIALIPKPDWETVLRTITEEKSRPSTEQRLGLSADAARLYEWIEALRPAEYLRAWTPVVEDRIKSEIGITVDWPPDNLPALIQMLADEISAKTQYQITLQAWNDLGRVKTRLKVVKPAPGAETLTEILATWIREKGVAPTAQQLHAALDSVAGSPAPKPPA